MVGEVLKAGERARDLVRQILTFSRKMESKREPVRMHLITKETLKLLRSTIPRSIDIREDIDPGAGPVDADPTKLHQVIMNLCTNAYHAMMPAGGTMTVSLREVVVDGKLAGRIPSLKQGPHLRLTVKDTGCGMGDDVISRIFDPFFTTKDKGRGTGLGLAMVYGIVADMGGAITVDSTPGRGSVFRVYLPVSAGTVRMAGDEDEEAPPAPSRGRILLVDDEESVITFSKLILEGLGYTVTGTSRSSDALRIFTSSPHEFDLVLSDCVMPELDGEGLARSIFSIRPDIPVVLMTGFSETITEEKAREMGIAHFIEKPFNRKTISAALSSCLKDRSN
jgi:CheY-like chemotaxis protein